MFVIVIVIVFVFVFLFVFVFAAVAVAVAVESLAVRSRRVVEDSYKAMHMCHSVRAGAPCCR